MITLVFVDKTTIQCSTVQAIKLCRDKAVSGYIIDALTPDTDLQAALRRLVDED